MKGISKSLMSYYRSHKITLILISILIFALILRLYFLVGLVFFDEQDEGIYFNNALNTLKKGNDFSRYSRMNESYLPNPVEAFSFRTAVYMPLVISFKVFGINEFSAIFFSLVYSLAGILVVFFIAKIFFGERVGLIASFLLSFFPLDVLFSTRLMPDIVVSFFVWLGLLFFFMAEKDENNKSTDGKNEILLYLLSGFSIGLGYLAKISVYLVLITFVVFFLYNKRIRLRYLYIVLGFLVVFIPEAIYYHNVSGHFALNSYISNKVYDQKITHENQEFIDISSFSRIWYLDGSKTFYYIPSIFGFLSIDKMSSINYFGFFGYLSIIAIIYLLFRNEKKSHFFIVLFLFLLLFLEFVPTFFRFFHDGNLIDFIVNKKPRVLTILILPSVTLISLLLDKLSKRTTAAIVFLLFLSSIVFINNGREYSQMGIISLREAAEFLKSHPDKHVFSDSLAADTLRIYTGYKINISYFPKNEYEIRDAYIIDYGSRGNSISPNYIMELRPPYFENASRNWKIVKIINNPLKYVNKDYKDLVIYYAE